MATQVVGTVREVWRYPFKSMAGEKLTACAVGDDGLLGDRGWAARDAAGIRGAKKLPALMQCSARYAGPPAAGEALPAVVITLPDGSTVRTDAPDAAERLSSVLGRPVTLWPRQPKEALDHYRRAAPDHEDIETELRSIFGRLPDEPLPDFSTLPPELFEFESPLGTYFDAFPLHILTTGWLAELAQHNPNASFDVRRFRPNLLIAPTGTPATGVEREWVGSTIRIGTARIAVTAACPRCVMTTHPQGPLPKDPSVLRTIVQHTAQNVGVYASVVGPGWVSVGDEVVLES